jgi:hypothetical protein
MTEYTPELAVAICEALAEGEGLHSICKRLNVARRTVRSWVERDAGFATRMQLARRYGHDCWAEEIIELADAVRSSASNAEVNAARLAVDARKWLLSKLRPELFGDRVELTGKDGRDLVPVLSPEAAIPRLMAVLAVLLPGSDNSQLHSLASTMASKLNGSPAVLPAPEGAEDGPSD